METMEFKRERGKDGRRGEYTETAINFSLSSVNQSINQFSFFVNLKYFCLVFYFEMLN